MQALPHWGTVPALKNLSLPIETNIKNRELKDKCSRSSLQLTHKQCGDFCFFSFLLWRSEALLASLKLKFSWYQPTQACTITFQEKTFLLYSQSEYHIDN